MISKILIYFKDMYAMVAIKYNIFLIRHQNISWLKKSIRRDTKKLHNYYIKSNNVKKTKNIKEFLENGNNIAIKKTKREIIYVTKGDYKKDVLPEMKNLILTYERSIEYDKENLNKIINRRKKA